MFDRPTLFTLGPGTQHQGAVMTLEAVEMIVLVQSSDSRCLGLTLLWNDWKLACGADQGEHFVIIFAAVGLVFLVQGDHLTIQTLSADTALETVMMKPRLPHHQRSVTV